MAEASNNNTPAGGDWSVDESMRYVARVTGKSAAEALYMLLEGLLAGKLSATTRHFVDGVMVGIGVVPPVFWRDTLALHVVEGRAVVLPLRALQRGDYDYTLPASDVRRVWPAELTSSKTLIAAEVMRRAAAGEHYGTITALSKSLHAWMKATGGRPLAARTIENRLRDWALWPLPPPK
jgi:hypothetical protein